MGGAMTRARVRRAAAVAAVVALALALLPGAPALAEDYPTWDEVAAAKADVTARESETVRIGGLIADLEVESGRLGDAAVEAAARAATAEAARAAAAGRATTLRTSAATAAAEADASAARFGRSAALLARTGGVAPTIALLGDRGDPTAADDLLRRLSRSSRVADLTASVAEQAQVDRAESTSLSAQADVAERERDRLARVAAEQAEAAEAAHEAAEARLAEQRATIETLYAQLAALRDSTADLERRYRVGEQARAEAAAREAAAAAAAGGATGTAPPPPGVVVDPAGHKAYARSAIGAYGWGDGEYQCLVRLWTRESSWRADAYNESSGAYGIPQALPGSKMAAAGADWRTDGRTQIDWGLGYIDARYGSPCGAWAHSERYNWY